jgi:hypothetical protein
LSWPGLIICVGLKRLADDLRVGAKVIAPESGPDQRDRFRTIPKVLLLEGASCEDACCEGRAGSQNKTTRFLRVSGVA